MDDARRPSAVGHLAGEAPGAGRLPAGGGDRSEEGATDVLYCSAIEGGINGYCAPVHPQSGRRDRLSGMWDRADDGGGQRARRDSHPAVRAYRVDVTGGWINGTVLKAPLKRWTPHFR